jgi:hypothetical protein
MSTTDTVLALLSTYGWVEGIATEGRVPGIWEKFVTTGPLFSYEQNRPWYLQFSVGAQLTVYITAPATSTSKISEPVGVVDPLYHDIDSLTARLIELQ